MIFALLIAALVELWYFGLPVQVLTSLSGSLVGVSIAFGMTNGFSFSKCELGCCL